MDNIQKYLRDNKSSFDTDMPDDSNWAKLSRSFNERKGTLRMRGRRVLRLGIAASLLLAAGAFAVWKRGAAIIARTPAQQVSVSAAKAPPQAEAVTSVYTPVISREMADLRQTSFYGHDRSVFKAFALQWKALEANERAIEQNMRSVGPNDQSIKQLTKNYELKIRLLQQFSVEIKKVKSYLPPADTLVKVPSLSLLSIKPSNYEKE